MSADRDHASGDRPARIAGAVNQVQGAITATRCSRPATNTADDVHHLHNTAAVPRRQ